ncbi:MAG: ABC transporter permease [Desulfobacterales bacterium]|nr:MAG: ABC transporter permease [Desulfobacterales bacterium]
MTEAITQIQSVTMERPFIKQLARLERWEKITVFAFVAPAMVLLLSLFVYPLIIFLLNSVFDPAFTIEHYVKAFTRPVYLRIFRITFEASLLTTIGALIIGYPVAYLFAHVSATTRGILLPLVLFPFWTSILVRMYAWMVLLGNDGVINQLLLKGDIISSPLPMLFNRFSVLVGMIHFMLPYMILTLYSVMAGIPKELTQAAASLGAPPYKQFFRVYLPWSMPGVGAGCLLVFILAVAFFVTPALLGGIRDTMISQVIQSEIEDALNWGFGAALSMLLMIVTTSLYLIYNRVMSIERIHGG